MFYLKKIRDPYQNSDNVTQGAKKLPRMFLTSRALRKLFTIEQNDVVQFYRTHYYLQKMSRQHTSNYYSYVTISVHLF